ncbi:DUF6160 family protein [Parendozoicomonas haliclonae]|uniref:DUF6160 domain-containing protein n=1 Tax=Parendozoicomonas haliclonae TaxID=1960125 RepID=A0A1X7APH4_9GAMM|nr:DUF6160 family protein [Parendozoicomonas haliclonae]SMA50155.1 hypothetical protein EHSB41UT_03946 [Parendozoicomonas haliclonae]
MKYFYRVFLIIALNFPSYSVALEEVSEEILQGISGRAGITIDQSVHAEIGSVAFKPGGNKSTGYIATGDDAGELDFSYEGMTIDVVKLTPKIDAIAIGSNFTFSIGNVESTGFYASSTPVVIPNAPLTQVPGEEAYGYLAELIIVPSAHNCDGALLGSPCDDTPPSPNDHTKNDNFWVRVNKGTLYNPQNMGNGSTNGSISSDGKTWSGNYGSDGTLGCYVGPFDTGSCDFSPNQIYNEQVSLIVAFDKKSDANINVTLETDDPRIFGNNADGYLWILDEFGNEIACSGRTECGNAINDGPGSRGEAVDVNLSAQLKKIPRAEPNDYTFLFGVGLSGDFKLTGTTYVFPN